MRSYLQNSSVIGRHGQSPPVHSYGRQKRHLGWPELTHYRESNHRPDSSVKLPSISKRNKVFSAQETAKGRNLHLISAQRNADKSFEPLNSGQNIVDVSLVKRPQ